MTNRRGRRVGSGLGDNGAHRAIVGGWNVTEAKSSPEIGVSSEIHEPSQASPASNVIFVPSPGQTDALAVTFDGARQFAGPHSHGSHSSGGRIPTHPSHNGVVVNGQSKRAWVEVIRSHISSAGSGDGYSSGRPEQPGRVTKASRTAAVDRILESASLRTMGSITAPCCSTSRTTRPAPPCPPRRRCGASACRRRAVLVSTWRASRQAAPAERHGTPAGLCG